MKRAGRRKVPYTSDQPGFALFFAAVFLAAMCGAAFHFYFSPERIRNQVDRALAGRTPGVHLEFAKTELILAEGIWPRLALRVSDVRVRLEPACGKGWGAEVDALIVPLRFSSLFTQKLKFHPLRINSITLRPDRFGGACAHRETADNSALHEDQPISMRAAGRVPASNSSSAFANAIRELAELTPGLDIKSVGIYFEHDAKQILLSDLSARLQPSSPSVGVQSRLQIPAEMTLNETLPPFRIEAEVREDGWTVSASGKFDEGLLEGTLNVTPGVTDRASPPVGDLSVKATGIPLSQFAPFLKKAGFLPQMNLEPRFLWLNCRAQAHGLLTGILKNNPTTIDNCNVEGDAGSIQIGHAVRLLDGGWEPFHATIARLDLKQILQTLGTDAGQGVLTDFGKLEGEFNYVSKSDQSFDGSLRGAEVLFSRHNVRAIQRIEQMRIGAKHQAGRIQGTVLDFVLREGSVKGDIKFDLKDDGSSGEIKLSTAELIIDPVVQRLMTDGIFTNLTVNGVARISERRITSWRGECTASEFHSDAATAKSLRAKINYEPGVFLVQAQAPEISLALGAPVFQWSQPVWTERGDVTSAKFKNLGFDLAFSDTEMRWTHAHLSSEKGEYTVASEGTVNRERVIDGTVSARSDNQSHVWQLRGTTNNPVLKPQ